MPPYMTSSADRITWRFRHLASGVTPRSDLTAGLAVVAVIGQLLVAPLTLGLVVILLAIGRISRWRPLWLMLPASVGLGWLLVIGLRAGLTGYLAGGAHVLGQLAGPGPLAVKLRQLPGVIANWRLWLPRQLPLALVAAALEAALVGLAGQARRTWKFRAGGLVEIRRRYLAATLRRGEIATRDGCCVGIVPGSGSRAEISWRDAESGVLCAGDSQHAVASTGYDLVAAAIQHRKAVVVIDLSGAATLSSPGSRAPEWIVQACAEVAAPLRFLDGRAAGYDPISGTSPARATHLVLAMVDWDGQAQARQLFCANYLNTALALNTTLPAEPVPGPASPVGELLKLLDPQALSARLASPARARSPQTASLAARVAELAGQLGADHDLLAPVGAQLGELGAAPLGRLLASGPEVDPISLRRALAEREVVHFGLSRPVHGRPAAMIARLVVADLISNLADYCDLGAKADCLVWINGCEAIEPRQLAALAGLGARAGTAVVLGTTSAAVAAALVPEVNVVAVRGTGPGGLSRLADLAGPAGLAGLAGPAALAGLAGPTGPTGPAGPAGDRDQDGEDDPLAALRGPGRPDVLSLWVGRSPRVHVADCTVVP
jgi:hypothetical protein